MTLLLCACALAERVFRILFFGLHTLDIVSLVFSADRETRQRQDRDKTETRQNFPSFWFHATEYAFAGKNHQVGVTA